VQHETFCRGLVAAVFLQENPQRVAQAGVVLVVGGQAPKISMTQACSSSIEPDIRASGATSPKLVTGGPDGPAARATAWAFSAC
jgi:hypothetical protein